MKHIVAYVIIIVLVSTIYTYGQNTGQVSFTPRVMWDGAMDVYLSKRFADMNGDGRDDLVHFLTSGLHVRLSTGNGWEPAVVWITDNVVPPESVNYWFFLLDMNRDGLPDLVKSGPGYRDVRLSNGSGFGPYTRWSVTHQNAYGFYGDVNGDGLPDLERQSEGKLMVSINTGTSFLPETEWPVALPLSGGLTVDLADAIFDINGDGKADLVRYNTIVFEGQLTVHVRKNLGGNFGQEELWFDEYLGFTSFYGFMDMDSDFKPDLLFRIGEGNDRDAYLRRNTGIRFSAVHERLTYDQRFANKEIYRNDFQDVTGDGKLDNIDFAVDGTFVRTSTVCNGSLDLSFVPMRPVIISRAENQIRLGPGVHIRAGTKFSAKTEPCSITTSQLRVKSELADEDSSVSDDNKHSLYDFAEDISWSGSADVSVYPNPAKGILSVYLKENVIGNIQVELLNQFNQKVFAQSFSGGRDRHQLDVSQFKGIYFVRISYKQNVEVIRVVLN